MLNAITQVENSKASIELAKIALDLAQKRVEADQKRYDLGTITLFFLLDSQTQLTQAQSTLVNQTVQYRRNLTNLTVRPAICCQSAVSPFSNTPHPKLVGNGPHPHSLRSRCE